MIVFFRKEQLVGGPSTQAGLSRFEIRQVGQFDDHNSQVNSGFMTMY